MRRRETVWHQLFYVLREPRSSRGRSQRDDDLAGRPYWVASFFTGVTVGVAECGARSAMNRAVEPEVRLLML